VERVKRFGFTPAELAREKKNNLSSIEKSYNERDKRQSAALAQEYIRLYLNNEASPGIEYEYELYKRFIPEISLEEINRLFATIFPEENRVLLVGAPERKDIPLPDSTRLLALFASVKKINLEPYQEAPVDKPLVSLPPQKGSIVKELQIPEVGITEWQLSNGVRVILKPTNFKNDEIVMRAFSPGGSSLVAEKDYVAAVTAADLVAMSGIGDFSRTELEKKLAGKEVGIAPSISELATGVSGSATPKDFETLCELVWLYFTAPKIDPDVFLAYKEKLATVLAQRRASPETVFFDMLQTTLTQDHFRTRPWTPEILSEFDIEASLRIYKDRFSDAGNFSFIFVGNFTPDSIRPFIETYIAGLPSSGRRETWKDSSITRPPGVVERTVQAGKDPKSMAAIVFHGEFPWQLSEVVGLHALAQAVEIRLTDVIRREEGGTYGLGVDDLPQRLPRQEYLFYITFGADPVRVDSLTAKVLAELHDLTTKGVTAEETAKTKEILLKEREVNLAGNTFWAGVLVNYYLYGEPPARILDYSNFVKELTPETLTGLARKYLREDSYVKAVLYPEESKK
jgi:zinc protease